MKRIHLLLALLAITLTAFIASSSGLAVGLLFLTLVSCSLNSPRSRLCAVTLSVPEILKDILEAFKISCPELFGPAGFAKDFSSDTAVIGTEIIGKISHTPVTADYDANNGGFKNGAQSVTSLIEDVPVTLNQLVHVPVKIPYLTGILATKGVDLYKAAVGNIGYALSKVVIDQVCAAAVAGCSNSTLLLPSVANLDAFDGQLRAQCNSQKMESRWALVSTDYAAELGSDDRVRSSLFYGKLNGDNGYRAWKTLGGFAWIREWPDVVNAGTAVGGIMGDSRFALVAVRAIHDMENAAKSLGIRSVMKFYSLVDEDSGLHLTGIAWQESGTGDVFLSTALLLGVGVGNQGGTPGSMTDNAGCIIRTA